MQTIPPLPFVQQDLTVATLGPATVPSPLGLSTTPGDDIADYVTDDARVLYDVETRADVALGAPVLFEKAGPREHIYFEPRKARAALVTCGGLCPGLNNVLRSMVLELHHKYRVASVLGFRYGYEGLDPSTGAPPIPLGPGDVTHIHRHGGSVLGLSRGKREVPVMVDTLVREGVDVLFTIGGDGTLRGAHAIAEEIARRGAPIAVVGVPKTIDNDVELVDRTFGFDTAVEVARTAIDAAHTEALGAYNGVGIVKLMGRDAGFIAAAATIASREVNFCLVPEVRFDLEGPAGLLSALEKRLAERQHAVIVVAEGCGAALASGAAERDASGNVRYASAEADIGPYLRDLVTGHLKSRGVRATVKYIDPSYMIRSVPANASDSIFCDSLARNAVHAGMAGKTDMVVGRIHGVFTHVPLSVVAGGRKRVNPDGGLWLAVTEATGQGRLWSGDAP
ncbi:MAG: ATP-dependent 6-phosphofructokinase [Polyangiaceae bacterium]|nr:ATP-dependent 6-phosphofructokinase [Polyangiaceae bacterium]